RLNHSNIRTQHLLFPLIKQPQPIAAKLLQTFNITQHKLIQQLQKLIPHPQHHLPTFHYTPTPKKVIQLSIHQATKLHHNFLPTQHILLPFIPQNQPLPPTLFPNLHLNITKPPPQLLKPLPNPQIT
ncbi:Clp protease N-terminal domain-containing protein, partial [Staphylococcus aureus]|uniref:Clp protease N-terminal domain-containing protein n=1 Tax=Staphylococcus aureus TaxID=1280 RepID=UPI0028CB8A53